MWNMTALGELALTPHPPAPSPQPAGCRLQPHTLYSTSCSAQKGPLTRGCRHPALQFQGWARPSCTESPFGDPFGVQESTLGSQSTLRRMGLRKKIIKAFTGYDLFSWELWGPTYPECSLEGGSVVGSQGAYRLALRSPLPLGRCSSRESPLKHQAPSRGSLA